MNRMPLIRSLSLFLVLLTTSPVLSQKQALYESINKRDAASWKAAQEIWELAEPGYQETKSAGILASMLKEAGFQVQKPVADIPTAFTATVGTGKPVIGILGEFDALPGLAQQASPQQESRPGNGYGHGCAIIFSESPRRRQRLPLPSRSTRARSRELFVFTAARQRRVAVPRCSWSRQGCLRTLTWFFTGTLAVSTRQGTAPRWQGLP